MAKKSAKKQKETSKVRKILLLAQSHKLIVFLLFLVLLFPALFAFEKYKDWDNAQMIKGLSRDFPELVEQIEQATQLDLELESNCMTTTEKFSSGVRTCEFLYYSPDVSFSDVETSFRVAQDNKNFTIGRAYENKQGSKFLYRNKESCEIRSVESIRGSCIVAVRESNIDLAKELLSR